MKNKINITALILLFTIAGFSQNKSSNTVSLDVFYSKIQNEKKPQIIDARGPEEFALNHIKGAVNFNLESKDYAQQVAKLDKTKSIRFLLNKRKKKTQWKKRVYVYLSFKKIYRMLT